MKVWLLVSRAAAESGVLARLARRTLSAQQSLGADVLTVSAPDESSVRSHVLAGAPLAHPEAPRRAVALCRCWSRAATSETTRLTQQRRLARRWRAELQTSRCCLTSGDRVPTFARLAGGNTLLCFSTPVVDGRGATLEKKIVLVRVPPGGVAVARDPKVLEQVRRWIARRLQSRARRLQRVRRTEAIRAAQRERAIFSAIQRSFELRELQPGLFDRRGVRSSERAAHEISELEDELDARLRTLEAESLLSVGVPALVFGIVSATQE